jgi:hypothetical protein
VHSKKLADVPRGLAVFLRVLGGLAFLWVLTLVFLPRDWAKLSPWEIQGPQSKEAHDYYAQFAKLEPDLAKKLLSKTFIQI